MKKIWHLTRHEEISNFSFIVKLSESIQSRKDKAKDRLHGKITELSVCGSVCMSADGSCIKGMGGLTVFGVKA